MDIKNHQYLKIVELNRVVGNNTITPSYIVTLTSSEADKLIEALKRVTHCNNRRNQHV